MRRIQPGKPSPALLVAIVALVAALTGTAVGGVAMKALSGDEKRQVRKIAKKVANKRIDRTAVRAAGTNVANADDGDGAILSTDITAPTDGHLVVVASVDSSSRFTSGGGDGVDGFDCIIKVDADPTEHGYRSVRVDAGANSDENCHTNALVPVEAGPHTVQFVGNSVDEQDVSFAGADLQVLFVRLDGEGG